MAFIVIVDRFVFRSLVFFFFTISLSNNGLTFVTSTAAVPTVKQQDAFYFDPAPVNQDVVEGEEVRLRCDVSNRRLITFYWTLNQRPLSNTSRRFQEGSDLRILWADRAHDNGSFRCIATNVTTGIALRSAEARLNIFWIDRIAQVELKQPKDSEDISEGTEVMLKCQADGNPEPIVEWYRNRMKLVGSDHIKLVKNRLRIVAVSSSSDNGVYSCRARNFGGQSNSTTDSFVINTPLTDGLQLNGQTFIKHLVVKRFDGATFHCQYHHATMTEWYHNNTRLVNSSSSSFSSSSSTGNKYVLMANGSLLINRVDKEDVGVYQCVGIASSGQTQTFSAELSLAYLNEMMPNMFGAQQPHVVALNGRYEFHCRLPIGLPLPTLRWTNPYNEELSHLDRIKSVNGVLTIQNAQEQDSGNYSCHASNLAGSVSVVLPIVISVAPKVSRPPLSTRVAEGGTAILDCKVTGTPYPVTRISWQFEEKILTLSERHQVDERIGNLKITDVQLSDEGNYACVVSTQGYPVATSANARLYVEKQLRFKPAPMNAKLDLGQVGKIQCKASGRTLPTIRWLKDDRAISGDHVQSNDGSLYFTQVEIGDAGNYTCIATNDQGSINITIRVDVVVRPRFKVKPVDTSGNEGHSAMMHCSAIGDPSPAIQWDKNGRFDAIDYQRFKVLANGSLYITELFMEDIGRYGCTAGNSGGLEREEVQLIVNSGTNKMLPDSDLTSPEVDSTSLVRTITIATCSVVAYLGLVIGLTIYCSLRLMRAKNMRKRALADATGQLNLAEKLENVSEPTEQTELMNRDCLTMNTVDGRTPRLIVGCSSQPSHSSRSTHSNNSHASYSEYDRLSFPRNQLQTICVLGNGYFGDVVMAKAFNIRNGVAETLVTVKSLLSHEKGHQDDFRQELELFGKGLHDNVVQLLAVSCESQPLLAIYEYCEWGTLKQYLKTARSQQAPRLTSAQNISILSQVSSGISYLAELHCVHRDIAARNILILPNLDVKIARLSLCRDVDSDDYFLFHQHLIPLRWMPAEAVLLNDFSEKSDVWSFGVFLWELYSLCERPLGQRSDDEVLRGQKTGENRLDCPKECPPEIWKIAEMCMRISPEQRPRFVDVANRIVQRLESRI